MNDDILVELLGRTADRIPASEAPVVTLVRDGRRLVRRRRRVAVAVVGAVLVVAGAGSALLAGGHPTRQTDAGQPPEPPAGTRWVGVGRSVVAVPRTWSMWPRLYCPSNDGHDHVTIVEAGVTVGCVPTEPNVPVSLVVSLEVQDGSFQVRVDASGPSAQQAAAIEQHRVEATRTTLPPGWEALPVATGALTADREASALEAAGFRVSRAVESAWGPGPAMRTVPAVGTPVRAGSAVTVYERRTPPASAGMSGRLLWVGGPRATRPAPHAGTVHVVGEGIDEYVPVFQDGRWSFQGPAGTFLVTASSPGYLSSAGRPDSCRAEHRVRLRWERTRHVDVYCQLR